MKRLCMLSHGRTNLAAVLRTLLAAQIEMQSELASKHIIEDNPE